MIARFALAALLLLAQVAVADAQLWGATTAVGQPYPLDNLPRPAAAYGTVRLLASYTANKALDLTLVNGDNSSTQTVGFVNGLVDAATGDAFCAASPSTCYITRVYDQSGNGCDATQSNNGSAPVWSAANAVSGVRPIVFNSIAHTTTGLTVSTKWLTTACPSWSPGSNTTFVFAGQNLQSHESRVMFEETTDTVGFMSAFLGFPPSLAIQSLGAHSATAAEVEPAILMFNWTGGAATVWSNDQTSTFNVGAQAPALGANLGSSDTTDVSNMDALALVLYTLPVSAGQGSAMRAALANALSIQQTYSYVLVNDGDSMSSGEGSLLDNSPMRFALPSINPPVRAYLDAVFGTTLATMLTNFSANIAPHCSGAYTACIIHIMAGENDIRAGTQVATIEANLRAYVNAVHAIGPNAKVIIGVTPMQCGWSGAQLTAYQQYTTDRISLGTVPQAQGGFGADGIANYWADPTIGAGNFTTSAFCNGMYSPDGGHPTDLTMGIMGGIEAAAVNALLH